VLFFDEFETLAKERGDRSDETGLQRAVSTLLTQIDDVPWYVVLIAATNHLELMDSCRLAALSAAPRSTEAEL
jgi:SpoVK/Ycf46/Vps4 family AAA+-type ATPase